ncbi:hypothetical protein KCU65_g105, partial [Aureobasidium melanogenum]
MLIRASFVTSVREQCMPQPTTKNVRSRSLRYDWVEYDSQTFAPRSDIPRLQLSKVLTHSDNCIAGFSQCILLTNAYSWAATKRDVAPAWSQRTIGRL